MKYIKLMFFFTPNFMPIAYHRVFIKEIGNEFVKLKRYDYEHDFISAN